MIIALIVFILIDYTTGVMCAIINKKLSSEVGAKGIFKKIMILLLVGVSHVLDAQIFHQQSLLRTAVIFFYLANEGVSIIENSAIIGLPVPKKLIDAMAQLRDGGD